MLPHLSHQIFRNFVRPLLWEFILSAFTTGSLQILRKVFLPRRGTLEAHRLINIESHRLKLLPPSEEASCVPKRTITITNRSKPSRCLYCWLREQSILRLRPYSELAVIAESTKTGWSLNYQQHKISEPVFFSFLRSLFWIRDTEKKRIPNGPQFNMQLGSNPVDMSFLSQSSCKRCD